MRHLFIIISVILFMGEITQARAAIINDSHADTTWKPYQIINQVGGNWVSHYIKGTGAYTGPYPAMVVLIDQNGNKTIRWIKQPVIALKSVIFNFNLTAQNIAGTVDVSGTPTGAGAVIVTDPATGWTIKDTVGAGRDSWRKFGGANNYSTGVTVSDGGGFALGQGVSTNLWCSLAWGYVGGGLNLDPWLMINNLKANTNYKLSFLMSLKSTSGAPTNDTMYLGLNNTLITDTILPSMINDNTSKLTASTVTSSAGGSILIRANASAGSNTSYCLINGLKIEEIQ